MIELASETDFVAKNEQFQTLAGDIVTHFANSSATDVDALRAETLKDGKTVEESVAGARRGDRREARTAPRREARRQGRDLPAPQVPGPAAAGRRPRAVRGRRRRGRSRCRDAGRGAACPLPHPRRRPGRGRRVRAPRARGEDPRRGQARAGDRQDRRGPAQRVLRRQRPARAGVGARGRRRPSSRCSTRPA